MNPQEQAGLVLTLAQVLYVNGQSTDDMLAATEEVGKNLGLRAMIVPTWEELHLEATGGTTRLVSLIAASPTTVHMGRVASTMKTINEVVANRLAPCEALKMAAAISHAPSAPTWQLHSLLLRALRHCPLFSVFNILLQ
jgi:hypothetical protein